MTFTIDLKICLNILKFICRYIYIFTEDTIINNWIVEFKRKYLKFTYVIWTFLINVYKENFFRSTIMEYVSERQLGI